MKAEILSTVTTETVVETYKLESRTPDKIQLTLDYEEALILKAILGSLSELDVKQTCRESSFDREVTRMAFDTKYPHVRSRMAPTTHEAIYHELGHFIIAIKGGTGQIKTKIGELNA